MARGWESKSVEEQQSEFSKQKTTDKSKLPPQERAKATERKRLELARINVTNQLKQAANPRYAAVLAQELAELDQRIANLK